MTSLASRLYHGETSIDFVGRWRRWFLLSGLAMLISAVALFVPGLRFGIDFQGGGIFRVDVPAGRTVTQTQVTDAVGRNVAKVVQVTNSTPRQVIVQTETLTQDQTVRVRQALARVAGQPIGSVSTDTVGSKWGSTVSARALQALALFLLAIVAYVSLRFEFKMAVAAIVALLHDLLITAGVYALARFEVTPATIIALLTILGYSLYDTVVVFDKVRENTGALTSMSKTTYSEAANRAVNQTLVRSLNTSLATLLPIAALLVVGAFLLGAETIKDLALALFVGVLSGTYSSIFIATPFLAVWKETEPRYRTIPARAARLQPGAAQAQGELPAGAGGVRAARGAGSERARARSQRARERTAAWDQPLLPRTPVPPDGDQAEPADAEPADAEPADAELVDEPAPGEPPEPARVAPAPAARPPQKPRPAQQRRKPQGRQSRPAKRRRR